MIPTTSGLASSICSICLLCVSASAQVPVEKGNLRAGASRIVITPAPDAALPMSGYSGRKAGFTSIHDDLHVRAIVVEDGMNQAALIACEVIGISSDLWQKIAERLTRETAIPRDNIILASVHTHAAPAIGTVR